MVIISALAAVALVITLAVLRWDRNDPTAGIPRAEPGSTSPATTEPVSPEQALRAEVAAGRSVADTLVGRWVPQLSSKRLGLNNDGITYGHREIYASFAELRARYPDALLVWSGDFASFRSGDYWVTLVAIPFATGEAANGWCDRQGIAAGDCYAKRLSHTGGYAEHTLHRG